MMVKRKIIMIFDSKFFFLHNILKKYTSQKASLSLSSPEKLAHLCLLKDFEPSPNCKMMKFLIFDNLFVLL